MKSAQNISPSPCKVAIVTGASIGIGLEILKRLIEKGYRVVANSRHITYAEAPGSVKRIILRYSEHATGHLFTPALQEARFLLLPAHSSQRVCF
jgi:NAD(P)-dependent dehydrogenase (short-subunit alcohol dehydrogenase family)